MNCWENELKVTMNLLDHLSILQMQSFQSNIKHITKKEDKSPVTEIDNLCERLIRKELTKKFPKDSILGEEEGGEFTTKGRCWTIDPIDGTRAFIYGISTFSTLICLFEDGIPVLGLMNFPATKERLWAVKGSGAFLNGNQIKIGNTEELQQSMGSVLMNYINPITEKYNLQEIISQLDYLYGFMDAYSYKLVATGSLDLAISSLDKIYDMAPASLIIQEAGGDFSDFTGKKEFPLKDGVIFGNKKLVSSILQILKPKKC